LVVLSTTLRLLWAGAIGPGNDEAYHYLYAVHPAWSYYDHPPMMAAVAWLSIRLCGGSATVFALRLGFVLLFAGSTLLMARLTRRHYGPWAGVMAAAVLNLSAYHTAAVGAFALPDGPLLFFWLLTLDQISAALKRPESFRPWLWVGVSWGCALLSKYHAVFLPAGAFLYMVASPSARSWLRRPGPYVAVLMGMIVFSPVLAWNASHGWSSFAFQAERATGALRFRPDSLLGAIGGPAIYLFRIKCSSASRSSRW
jgi:4-amino-4-deoxy-L-arabinose transferase-like glycosyltransferase